MKNLYLIIIALFSFSFSFAAPVNTVITNNGVWDNAATWSLNRVPANGDTVYVPGNYTLVVDNNVNLTKDDIYIKIAGTLELHVGTLNLSDNSIVNVLSGGTIVTIQNNKSDKIEIGSTLKYSGTEGNLPGPLMASKTTATSPFGFQSTSNFTLPVQFISFTVSGTGNENLIQWATAEEVNAAVFEVERSTNGSNWASVTRVLAVGNSTLVNNYSYTDKNSTSGIVYYRIKQIDRDGQFVYTAVKSIKNQSEKSVEIKISSSVHNNVVIHFSSQVKGNVMVRLISLTGQVVAQQTLTQPAGQVIYNQAALKGNYILSVSNGQDVNAAQQVIL